MRLRRRQYGKVGLGAKDAAGDPKPQMLKLRFGAKNAAGGPKPQMFKLSLILLSAVMTPVVIVACNAIGGIEPATLGLCPDGSRVIDMNCESVATSGTGGYGGTSSGANGSSSSGTGTTPCQTPWQRYDPVGDRCYLQEYVTREWASAEQRCVDLGGHLVAIDSAYELGLLGDWVGPEVWIGGTDATKEGVFVWTNDQPWSFASWKNGVPTDQGGNRDCVMLVTPSGGLPVFDCRSCSEKLAYVCESSPLHP